MMFTARTFLSMLAATALISAVACGDDDGETTDTPADGAGGTQSGGGHGGGGDGSSVVCTQGCADLWVCTQEGDMCPGLPPEAEESFIQGCQSSPICDTVARSVDPNDCPGTVDQISSLSVDFSNVCGASADGGADH